MLVLIKSDVHWLVGWDMKNTCYFYISTFDKKWHFWLGVNGTSNKMRLKKIKKFVKMTMT